MKFGHDPRFDPWDITAGILLPDYSRYTVRLSDLIPPVEGAACPWATHGAWVYGEDTEDGIWAFIPYPPWEIET